MQLNEEKTKFSMKEQKTQKRDLFRGMHNLTKDTMDCTNKALTDEKFMSCTPMNKSPFASSTGSVLNQSVTLP